MSRKPSAPPEAVERALNTAKTTHSAIELRRALAVTLPMVHGLSIRETATVLGRSETWVAKERQSYIRQEPRPAQDASRGGRRNQLIPSAEEDAFMEEVCRRYIHLHSGWRLGGYGGPNYLKKVSKHFVEFTQDVLEEHIQRKTTRTTTYNLLARTGKKRFANYEPYMWAYACRKEMPSALYRDDKIADYLLKRYNLSRKKPRVARS